MGEKRKRTASTSKTELDFVVTEVGERGEKKAKTVIEEPTTQQPLTRANLRLLEKEAMGRQHSTGTGRSRGRSRGQSGGRSREPAKSRGSSKSIGSRKSKSSGPTTDTKTETSKSVRELRQILRVNNLIIDDEDAREEADPFGKLALEIIDEERKSAMKPGDQAEILKTRKKYELRGEMTFVEVMWKLITGEDRSIKQEDEHSIVNDEGLFTRPWKTDFLDKNWDTLFKSTCIPKVDVKDDEELQTLIYQYPRVATPKPDLAYALELDAFQSVKKMVQRKDIEELAMLSPLIYFPFFVIEFKSHQGTIEEAETQACRSGAAIIHSMRKLKAMADILDEVHAHDAGSFVFSLAMVPAMAHLHVHWATIGEDGNTVYHMTFVKPYTLRTGSNVAALHHDINNILEWGVGRRVVYITELLPKISKSDSR